MKFSELKPRHIFLLIIISVIILASIVPMMRIFYGMPLLTGDLAYYHADMAGLIAEEGMPIEEPLIERQYVPDAYHLLLSGIGRTENIAVSSVIIPAVLGLLSSILFYLILKQLGMEIHEVYSAVMMLILSPTFVFLSSTSNSFAFPVFMALLGFYLFIISKKTFAPSFVIFSAMPFLGVMPSIISASALLVYSLNNRHRMKHFFMILSSITIILAAYHAPMAYNYGLPNIYMKKNLLTRAISGLGGEKGLGMFNIIVGAIGMYILWGRKKHITGYLIFFGMLVFSYYIEGIYPYMNLALAVFAGIGFARLARMKWEIGIIKKLTVLLIICGLVFSTVSYINRTGNSLPDKSITESLEWLKKNSEKGEIVFSHYSKGMWIENIGNRKVILDPKFDYIHSLEEKLSDSETIFYSRNLKTTKKLLDKYDIRYIWIDKKMKKGQVWAREDQGLLFLFRNKENFEKMYSEQGIEIWKVL